MNTRRCRRAEPLVGRRAVGRRAGTADLALNKVALSRTRSRSNWREAQPPVTKCSEPCPGRTPAAPPGIPQAESFASSSSKAKPRGHIGMRLVDHQGHMTMWPAPSAEDRACAAPCEGLVVATRRCGPLKAERAAAVNVLPPADLGRRSGLAGDVQARTRRPRSARAQVMHSSILIPIPYRCINWPGTACLRHATSAIACDLES